MQAVTNDYEGLWIYWHLSAVKAVETVKYGFLHEDPLENLCLVVMYKIFILGK